MWAHGDRSTCFALLTPLLLAVLAAAGDASDDRSVVAVFPILDSTGRLEDDVRSQLTDYLRVKITEHGAFYLVPRKEIDAALKTAKANSYRACYDQRCQIEIGKELAAQKILHAQIVQVGDHCAVTATIYDLRIAATDKATSHKAGCTENELVVSLETVAAQLSPARATPGSAAVTAIEPAAAPAPIDNTPKFGLLLQSAPEGAEVLLDGRSAGRTPTQLSVDDTPHRITLQHDGYESFSEEVTLDADTQRSIALRLTRDDRASRIEWLGLSFAATATFSGSAGAGVWMRAANLQFGSFSWTVLDLYLGLLSGGDYNFACDLAQRRATGYCDDTGVHINAFVGTRPGWTFPLDSEGIHALEASLGAGLYIIGESNNELSAFALSPSIRYLHRSDSSFVYGAGIRLVVPLATGNCTAGEGSVYDYVRCSNSNPLTVQLEVPFGWYF